MKFFQYDSTFGRESNGQYSHELTGFRSMMVHLGQFWSIWSISLPLASTPDAFIVLYWRWSKMIFNGKNSDIIAGNRVSNEQIVTVHLTAQLLPSVRPNPTSSQLGHRTLKCVLCDRSLDYRRVNLLLKIR